MATNDDGTNKNLCSSIMPTAIGHNREKRKHFSFQRPFPSVEILASGSTRDIRAHVGVPDEDIGFGDLSKRTAQKRQQKQHCSCNHTHAKPPLVFTYYLILR